MTEAEICRMREENGELRRQVDSLEVENTRLTIQHRAELAQQMKPFIDVWRDKVAERDAELTDKNMTIETLRDDIYAIESKLNETFTDQEDIVWERPTAWAYMMVCKANEQKRLRIVEFNTALAARGASLSKLEAAADAVIEAAIPMRVMGEISHYEVGVSTLDALAAARVVKP